MQKNMMASLILFLTSFLSLPALEISEQDASTIAQKIWMNECNQTIEGLLSWNQGESFASLGIGHFIWYPIGKEDKFVETFRELIQFFKDHQVQLPPWLTPKTTCPWHSREEFEKNKRSGKMLELRNLLTQTITLQALFMAERFTKAETTLVKDLPKSEAEHVQAQIERLGKSPGGTYALLDYLNFKGAGTNSSERYEEKGWGLLQVLLRMPGNTDNAIEEFIAAANKVLTDRVELSPPQRNEARWLPGWLNRVKTYRGKTP
ncbi:MAG: hypothetical protein JSR93_04770 [Verrucomicrobia bacterium]|nr:hypothetical protein [Verrucomicrobiota bacterium]